MLMSKRLQVILDDEEMSELREVAKRNRMSVAEWVRQALRAARLREPVHSREQKLAALRTACEHAFPAGTIEEMLEEIERGYLGSGD